MIYKKLFSAFILLFWVPVIVLAQIPENIDVATEGDQQPISEAPQYVLALIIILVISVAYYLIRKRRK